MSKHLLQYLPSTDKPNHHERKKNWSTFRVKIASCMVVFVVLPAFPSGVNGAPASLTPVQFSWLAMFHVVSIMPRHVPSRFSSMSGPELMGYFFHLEVSIECINAPCLELPLWVLNRLYVEITIYVVFIVDAMICNRYEDMTTRVAQHLWLVASALSCGGANRDNPLYCSSVVGFHKLSSYINLPLISKFLI
jgi:hypothetical protein